VLKRLNEYQGKLRRIEGERFIGSHSRDALTARTRGKRAQPPLMKQTSQFFKRLCALVRGAPRR
jgi:hypothetical protein